MIITWQKKMAGWHTSVALMLPPSSESRSRPEHSLNIAFIVCTHELQPQGTSPRKGVEKILNKKRGWKQQWQWQWQRASSSSSKPKERVSVHKHEHVAVLLALAGEDHHHPLPKRLVIDRNQLGLRPRQVRHIVLHSPVKQDIKERGWMVIVKEEWQEK
jgi:hypothetical protein